MINAELVIRFQQGDIAAFNDIYWAYHRNLYSNILKLIKEHDATQDILQEVFIVFWEKRQTIDVTRPVSNWLFVVSYNKSIDYLKKRHKQNISFDGISDIINAETDDMLSYEKKLALLEKAIDTLSPQRRKVFELCKIQRKTYEETAVVLNISKHTVKEYLSTAVVNIKDYVKSNSVV